MNTKLTLKNFRVFDNKQGGTFNLAPITILTGCNSSGKSSLVKSLLLLKEFFQELATNKINDCKLDFSNKLAKLGKYDLALNNSCRDSKMCIKYTITPAELGEEVLVKLVFSKDPNDFLNNGWIEHITISKSANNAIILDASLTRRKDEYGLIYDVLHLHKCNLYTIRKNFLKTVYKNIIEYYAGGTSALNYQHDAESIRDVYHVLHAKLKRLMSQDEMENFVEIVDFMHLEGLMQPLLYKNWELYADTSMSNIMFSVPILSSLESVNKQDVGKTLLSLIGGAKNQIELEYYLSKVISKFEESKFEDFIAYYKAKEKEGLIFRNLTYNIYDGSIFGADPGKKVTPKEDINTFSNFLDLNNTDILLDKDTFTGASFSDIYTTMAAISRYVDNENTERYIGVRLTREDPYEEHKVFTDYCNYFDKIISEALSPDKFKKFQYVGESAIELKRIYTMDNMDEMGLLLTKYLEVCRKPMYGKKRSENFIDKWVKAFGVGDRVAIEYTTDGIGVLVRLFKNTEDKIGRSLVDEGFGITKLIVTLINIELAILSKPKHEVVTLAIEEPENHLHPRYQSLLAEMFADAYKNYGIHFIVETHSEYMVRKLQTLVAKKELTPDEVSLQYLYSPDIEQRPKGEPQVKNIPIREDGILKEPFGPGFLDEADNLAMDILTIKAMS